jgi:hypothetical protein
MNIVPHDDSRLRAILCTPLGERRAASSPVKIECRVIEPDEFRAEIERLLKEADERTPPSLGNVKKEEYLETIRVHAQSLA